MLCFTFQILPIPVLLVWSQKWKHWRNEWNMFKVNKKGTKTTSMTSFWCLYCWLWTNFANCFGVSITDFEQLNADWAQNFTNLLNLNNIWVLKRRLPVWNHWCWSTVFLPRHMWRKWGVPVPSCLWPEYGTCYSVNTWTCEIAILR